MTGEPPMPMPSLQALASPSRGNWFACEGRFGPGAPASPNAWEANCPACALGANAAARTAIVARSSPIRAIAVNLRKHGPTRLSTHETRPRSRSRWRGRGQRPARDAGHCGRLPGDRCPWEEPVYPPREAAAAMRGLGAGGRLAAMGALVGGIALVALLLFGGGGSDYSVRIEFRNAGQLVKGDTVQVGGAPAGSVRRIELAPNGLVVVTATVDEPFAPLRHGTSATIRQVSQAGVANRYVDPALPPGNARDAGRIPDGGTIDSSHTTTIVDLDEVFSIFDRPTRHAVRELLARSHEQYRGKTDELRALYLYLNPSLSTSNAVFREVNRDTAELERFIVGSGRLVTALADRRTDLSGAVTHLNTTFRSIGDERLALAEAVRELPPFMRQATTPFVDLRAPLDDVAPLVAESKPVARKLRPLLDELRPLARDARPTVRSLRSVVVAPGADNDLTDLTRSFPALERIALEREHRSVDAGGGPTDVGTVAGAFPETATALRDSAPVVAFGRPYTPDLIGWFDDFSTSGATDALGGITRVLTTFNAISPLGAVPALIPLGQRGTSFQRLANTGQYKRCPGAAEVPAADGSNVPSAEERRVLDCREEDRAAGRVATP